MKMDKIAGSQNDEFYTPPYAIYPILKYLKKNSVIWCPFDTDCSWFVKLFKEHGHEVVFSHLNKGEDFFKTEKKCDYIISNPPYSLKAEVFQRLFLLNIPFAMLVGIVGLFESQNRFNMFKDNKFEIMYFNKRISYFKNYDDQKPSINPPFSSVYITKDILPDRIIFETLSKK